MQSEEALRQQVLQRDEAIATFERRTKELEGQLKEMEAKVRT